jgi:hypothetical protein
MTRLEDLVAAVGPFATAALSSPSAVEDADARFEIGWKNARRALDEAGLPDDDVAAIDARLTSVDHAAAPAIVIVRAVGGPLFVEQLGDPIERDLVVVDSLPRLGPILEDRQRAVAHVVVETDRAGASLTSFDAGGDAESAVVEGERLHIHRGHPGGWSQRRFQQRAENRWEANATDVADATASAARKVGAEFIAVAGDVRAVGFLIDHLPADLQDMTVVLEAGSPGGIAEETVRIAADVAARRTRDLLDALRTQRAANAGCVGVDATLAALVDGRVETLLVHDDVDDDRRATWAGAGEPVEGRLVDVAIHAAVVTDARVHLIPAIGDVDDGLGAILRW